MVTMNVGDNFTYTLAAVPAGSVIDGPPTAPVDNPGIVNITPSADGLTVNVVGAAPGTCTITPTALANGITITGTPIQVQVNAPTPPPPVFATGLAVTVGPVVPASPAWASVIRLTRRFGSYCRAGGSSGVMVPFARHAVWPPRPAAWLFDCHRRHKCQPITRRG